MEITQFFIKKLRNSARLQFHTEYRDLYSTFDEVRAKVSVLFDAYSAAFAQVEEAFKKIAKSAFTEEIEKTDEERDTAISGMREIVTANTKHFEEDIKSAAKRIKVVFDSYKNIAKKPIHEETAEITNLLQELKTKHSEDIPLIGISKWLEHLEKLNKQFDALIKERDNEKAAQSPVVLKDALEELDGHYNKLNKRISALAEIEGGGINSAIDYEEFITRLNVLIARYNKI